ncbi:ATP-binding cassette domain-containing protein [Alteribacter natronophilus]|uniref:ATP-binding cassette domain-containing protein n=1 Tax=Alteribacter natronophilus TaxID=2583810 RepID=UPI00110E3978|nr:ABC transporter ATP-binding protein [Alteribacter natronophilus]TMW70339.1 ABC transporter ATP-binding protein [Alteribacter natronophilus]
MTTAVQCREITKTYKNKRALNELSCTIEKNKITGIIGRNGAGKTTLLNMIAGHRRVTDGEIQVFGANPFNSLTVSANIVFINDTMNLPNGLTCLEILEEGQNFYRNWDHELAGRLFEYFGFTRHDIHERLSKGKRSMFNAIFGLASRSPLTIFDEPTTGMDEAVRKDFYRALLKDYIAHPRTVLLSSHHLSEIEDLLEDVLLIKNGREHLHMPVSDLKEYAVSIQGSERAVTNWLGGKNIIARRSGPAGRLYAVVENTIHDTHIKEAREKQLDLSPVSASDVCVYLTDERKGGIDDVFE